MTFLSLHPNQIRILTALRSVGSILGMKDQIVIVGSLAKFLAGTTSRVGDIDVMLGSKLCKRFWPFLEILDLFGVTPVYDLLKRPNFPWRYCRRIVAHPLALTADTAAHLTGLKHANLDIVVKVADLKFVQDASEWVYGLDPDALQVMDEPTRTQTVKDDHQRFIKDRKEREAKEKPLSAPTFDKELNLSYALGK
jgi:hypothetical protein